jgi:hypothetical protein
MVRYYGLYSNRYRNLRGTTEKQPEQKEQAETEGQFDQHLDYWKDTYGEEALVCKDCQLPFQYYGQYFPYARRGKMKPKETTYDDST